MAFYKGGALKWTPSEDGDIHRGDVRINAHHPMMALYVEGALKCSPSEAGVSQTGDVRLHSTQRQCRAQKVRKKARRIE